ncbi:glycoside hydrolase family 18 protein [Neobacillus niacini]|uniref:glycoside hydrolase family 18 protein n=1 Tax=Neobacillus niacini TaxID=86668 RepID=UPI002862A7B3|nr:glycoside hydrolase family 18 protein [Neobacillus niacini]MDR7001091.1 GH18 family chitinase [Neobacillus niacini]
MKKRMILLTLVILITFTGGFLSGIFYSGKKAEQATALKIEQAPKSAVKPEQKSVPKWEQPKQQSKVLINYVQDFRDPNVVDYSKITHVIFSFAHPMKDGSIGLNGKTALTNLRTMVSKAHSHHVKAMVAVGGWYHMNGGESYEYFKTAISNPVSRTKLVSELTSLTKREKLDGIDIDFEFPRSTKDAQNLTKFTKELSEKLHAENKELSMAVNSKVHAVTGTVVGFIVYDPLMFQYTDHVNIMAYDGQWDGGYHASNLAPYPLTEKIVNYWTNLFKTNHLSTEKLVLGVPAYAQPVNPQIKQVSYAAIVHKNPANATKNVVQMNGTTYYYNGETTMKLKTQLALDHGFGGMMMWEAGHDAKGQDSLSTAIFDTLKESKQYTYKQ